MDGEPSDEDEPHSIPAPDEDQNMPAPPRESMSRRQQKTTAVNEARRYVQEHFSAVLVWEHNQKNNVYELNPECSSALRLSFVAYAHGSRAFVFSVGTGLIGRCASLPLGSVLCMNITPDTTMTEYHRLREARTNGIRAICTLHWDKETVLEFASSEELDPDAHLLEAMVREFADDFFSTVRINTSAIFAAHSTYLREARCLETTGTPTVVPSASRCESMCRDSCVESICADSIGSSAPSCRETEPPLLIVQPLPGTGFR